ncbi:MAG: FHA domain-containing protein [Phycisphaerae bacterium]|nr:FHA domain-containing protein [Phycisphaerae bacterium]
MTVNLVLLKRDGTTQSFTLPSNVTSIGRRQDCDFCLPLSMVSRKHCELSLDQGQVMIRDSKSRNGTFLNGRRVDEARLNPGDLIQVGPVKFVLQIDGQPASFEHYLKPSEGSQEKTDAHDFEKASMSDANHSEATEMLDSIPDEFDIDADLEKEFPTNRNL